MKTTQPLKSLFLAFIGIAFATQLAGQKLNMEMSPFFTKQNQIAYFNNFENYLNEHLKYPVLAQYNGVEGIVKVEVEIDSFGKITSAKIICGLGNGCDEAVLNLFYNMPIWNPGLKNGIPRLQKLVIPIKFSLR